MARTCPFSNCSCDSALSVTVPGGGGTCGGEAASWPWTKATAPRKITMTLTFNIERDLASRPPYSFWTKALCNAARHFSKRLSGRKAASVKLPDGPRRYGLESILARRCENGHADGRVKPMTQAESKPEVLLVSCYELG